MRFLMFLLSSTEPIFSLTYTMQMGCPGCPYVKNILDLIGFRDGQPPGQPLDNLARGCPRLAAYVRVVREWRNVITRIRGVLRLRFRGLRLRRLHFRSLRLWSLVSR